MLEKGKSELYGDLKFEVSKTSDQVYFDINEFKKNYKRERDVKEKSKDKKSVKKEEKA